MIDNEELQEMKDAGKAFGINIAIDLLESKLVDEFPLATFELNHSFVPGFYVRQIHMKAGTFLTSKIHKTRHPFVITKGVCRVWTKETGVIELSAVHSGITEPNTRRVLYIIEDTVWTTFHPTELTNIDEIEKLIIQPRYNKFIKGSQNEHNILEFPCGC